jgi:hypothetical protein
MKVDLNKIGNIKMFASVDIISDYIGNTGFYRLIKLKEEF